MLMGTSVLIYSAKTFTILHCGYRVWVCSCCVSADCIELKETFRFIFFFLVDGQQITKEYCRRVVEECRLNFFFFFSWFCFFAKNCSDFRWKCTTFTMEFFSKYPVDYLTKVWFNDFQRVLNDIVKYHLTKASRAWRRNLYKSKYLIIELCYWVNVLYLLNINSILAVLSPWALVRLNDNLQTVLLNLITLYMNVST